MFPYFQSGSCSVYVSEGFPWNFGCVLNVSGTLRDFRAVGKAMSSLGLLLPWGYPDGPKWSKWVHIYSQGKPSLYHSGGWKLCRKSVRQTTSKRSSGILCDILQIYSVYVFMLGSHSRGSLLREEGENMINHSIGSLLVTVIYICRQEMECA